MDDFSVRVNYKEIQRKLANMQRQMPNVLAKSTRRAIITGRYVLAKEGASKYNLTQKEIKNSLRVKQPTSRNPVGIILLRDTHRNLYTWQIKSVVGPRRVVRFNKPRIYSAKVKKTNGRIRLSGDRKPFVQTIKGQNGGKVVTLLLRRQTSSPRAKLEGVSGPSIPQMLKKPDILEKFSRKTSETLKNRIDHEIKRVLEG